jgi:amino acid transporter
VVWAVPLYLIFWAYVGFELVTISSDDIINPKRTIPLAIGVGVAVITVFYFLTNFVIVGAVPWMALSTSSAPLTLAGYTLLGAGGAIILSIGALFSISGSMKLEFYVQLEFHLQWLEMDCYLTSLPKYTPNTTPHTFH